MNNQNLVVSEKVYSSIYLVREQKVMIDSDLAELYGVQTKRLNEQVKRNFERFPKDFMFQLTEAEWVNLKSQFATSSLHQTKNWGGRRTPPFVFTELGIAMLSSVLNSQIAIQVNIAIMRVFVDIRKWSQNYSELISHIEGLSKTQSIHAEHIRAIYELIEELIKPKLKERIPVGFKI